MSEAAARFRRWHVPWKERICDEAWPFSHGVVFRSRRRPDLWEYNCIRLDRPMEAGEMIAAADRELTGCAHRFVEWMIPMPDIGRTSASTPRRVRSTTRRETWPSLLMCGS